MDRHIVYPGSIPLETDLLFTNRHVAIEVGMSLLALLGTGTYVAGLACTPTSPASLQVNIGPGSIFAYGPVDSTAYSSLAADTTDQIQRQGILINGGTTLTLTPPGTTGQSISYLVEASYADTDANPVVLPYYNAANPAVAFSGPNNTGTPQNTVRKGQCVITLKAGAPAPTGSQVTPIPDAGAVGLYVITVANGQTTIAAGNISTYPGAPFINPLNTLITASQAAGVVGSMRNATMNVAAASASATFTADEIIVETALGGLRFCLANYSQTINLATTGAGGMDTGAAPTTGYVALYAIYNPTMGAASILARNATASVAPNVYGGANMPAGYTASALISVWPTNASGQLVAGIQADRSVSIGFVQVLTSNTVQSSPAALSIAAAAPKNAREVFGTCALSSTAASNVSIIIMATSNAAQLGATGINLTVPASGYSSSTSFRITVSSAQTIFYTATNTAGTPTYNIGVSGYTI